MKRRNTVLLAIVFALLVAFYVWNMLARKAYHDEVNRKGAEALNELKKKEDGYQFQREQVASQYVGMQDEQIFSLNFNPSLYILLGDGQAMRLRLAQSIARTFQSELMNTACSTSKTGCPLSLAIKLPRNAIVYDVCANNAHIPLSLKDVRFQELIDLTPTTPRLYCEPLENCKQWKMPFQLSLSEDEKDASDPKKLLVGILNSLITPATLCTGKNSGGKFTSAVVRNVYLTTM